LEPERGKKAEEGEKGVSKRATSKKSDEYDLGVGLFCNQGELPKKGLTGTQVAGVGGGNPLSLQKEILFF